MCTKSAAIVRWLLTLPVMAPVMTETKTETAIALTSPSVSTTSPDWLRCQNAQRGVYGGNKHKGWTACGLRHGFWRHGKRCANRRSGYRHPYGFALTDFFCCATLNFHRLAS